MSRTRILIFIDWFLPGYKAGGPIQSCANLVEHLKEDFEFWVITRDTDYCEAAPYPSVKSDGWNTLAPYLKVFYSSAANLNYSTLTKAASEVQPDVVFINGIYSFYFSVLPLRIAKKLGCKTIVSARGMLAPSAIQVKGGKKRLFLKASQTLGLYKGVSFHATNEAEVSHIEAVFGSNNEIKIAPNLPKHATLMQVVERNKQEGKLRLVSIARISPEKNTLYALKVLKNYAYTGTIAFDLYGPVYNESYWKECQEVIRILPNNIQVNYKGSLESNQVHQTLLQYDALLLPTRGENFGHIILESLSAGLPVLISDQTPWRKLQVNGISYDLPLSKPEFFAEAIQKLIDMPREKYKLLSRNAYNYAIGIIQDPEALAKNKALFYS